MKQEITKIRTTQKEWVFESGNDKIIVNEDFINHFEVHIIEAVVYEGAFRSDKVSMFIAKGNLVLMNGIVHENVSLANTYLATMISGAKIRQYGGRVIELTITGRK